MKKTAFILTISFVLSAFTFVKAGEYVAFVKEGKVFHMIDETGKVISKQPMTKVMTFFNGYASCVIAKKWHYIDQQGNAFTVDQDVEKLNAFKDGLGAFMSDDYWGFMNDKGEVVIKPAYESVKMFNNGRCWVKKDSKWFQIDKMGTPVFSKRFVSFHNFNEEGIARVKEEKLWGFINEEGEEVAGGFIYTANSDFYNGKAFVKKGSLWGVIDREGTFIIEPKYIKVWHYFKNGYAFVKEGEYIGIIDSDCKVIVKPKYIKITAFKEGFCGAKLDEYWEVIDRSGKVIATKLNGFSDFQEGYSVIKKDEQTGLLSASGKIELLGSYDRIKPFVNGVAMVYKNSRWGYINKNLEEIISPQFLAAKEFYSDWAIVKAESELWGYVDKTGTFIIPAAYEKPNMFIRNKQADKNYGCNQNTYAHSEFSALYSRTKLFFVKADMVETNVARVKYEGRWSFIDKSGKLILAELDNAENWVNGFAKFRKDGLWGFIDQNGNVVVEPKYNGAKEMTKVCK